ncbi:MAG: hypothetical protein ABIG89_02900 [Candidatus Woesearchaeota archaeon]
MKVATIYFGSLSSRFATMQDWSNLDLGILASDNLNTIQGARISGTKVFSYTHRKDSQQESKLQSNLNDGLFLDWATAPNEYIDSLVCKLHQQEKKMIVNTGWGTHRRYDYGSADIVLFESFLGTNSGDDGNWPVMYSRRDEQSDLIKLRALKTKGYEVIALTYGPSSEVDFALSSFEKARIYGCDYFIYSQAPGWEKEGSGFRLFTSKDFQGKTT